MRPAALAALAACVHLAHVEPQVRSLAEISAATVRVEVSCGDDEFPIAREASGTGVVISARHVLTAAHVVRCPVIPVIHVVMTEGGRLRMDVEREDVAGDVARLELASAGAFGLRVAPPALGSDGIAIAAVNRPVPLPHGRLLHDMAIGMQTERGDSGAAVYDDLGRLVGLVVGSAGCDSSGMCATQVAPVGPSWLEGT